MKLQTIISPNEKGQIVIPQKVRDALGIGPNTFLSLVQTEHSFSLTPITDVVTSTSSDNSYLAILEKTAGSWAHDNWNKINLKRKQIEQKAWQKQRISW